MPAAIEPPGERLRRLAGPDHPRSAELIAAADALRDAGPASAAGLYDHDAKRFDPAVYMAAWRKVGALVKALEAEARTTFHHPV